MTDSEHAHSSRATLSFALTAVPNQAARALVSKRLDEYNEHTGAWDNTVLDVFIFDETKELIGGLVGRTSLGVFFVDYLFLPDHLRGNGYGTHVLCMAEQE